MSVISAERKRILQLSVKSLQGFSSSMEGSSCSAPLQTCPGFDSREFRKDLIQTSVMTWAVLVPASCGRAVGVT